MESNSVCNHTSNEQDRTTAKLSLICQSRVWLLTELDDTKSCYQLIITLTIKRIKLNQKTKKKIHLGQTSSAETVSKVKISPFLKFPSFLIFIFVQNRWLLLWLLWSIWSILWLVDLAEMIGCFNCPITGVRLQPTVRLQMYKMTKKQLMRHSHWGNCYGYD